MICTLTMWLAAKAIINGKDGLSNDNVVHVSHYGSSWDFERTYILM